VARSVLHVEDTGATGLDAAAYLGKLGPQQGLDQGRLEGGLLSNHQHVSGVKPILKALRGDEGGHGMIE
jgi:hypothetical protein